MSEKRPEVPEGEEVLMEGAFDANAYKREAIASVVAVVLAFVVMLLVFSPGFFTSLALWAGAGALFLWAYLEYRAGRGRAWALTERALYVTGRAPVPIAAITRIRGSFANVRLNIRGQPRLVILGEARAVELRNRLRDLMSKSRA